MKVQPQSSLTNNLNQWQKVTDKSILQQTISKLVTGLIPYPITTSWLLHTFSSIAFKTLFKFSWVLFEYFRVLIVYRKMMSHTIWYKNNAEWGGQIQGC